MTRRQPSPTEKSASSQSPRRRFVLAITAASLLGLAGLGTWLASVARTPHQPKEPAPRSAAEMRAPTESTRRYASLSPAITETLVALGASQDLVAVSDFDAPSALPRVGTVLSPNFEKLAQAEPTLILATETQSARITELARIAPTHEIPWLSLDQVASGVEQLGKLTGQAQAGEALSQRLRAELAPTEVETAPRVLLVIGGSDLESGSLFFIRQRSLHGALLGALGYRHAIEDDPQGPPRLSFEQLLQVDPDAIVVLRPETPDPEREARLVAPLTRLTPLSANREHRIAVLAREGLLTMGPAVLESKRALGEVLARLFPPPPGEGQPRSPPRSQQAGPE